MLLDSQSAPDGPGENSRSRSRSRAFIAAMDAFQERALFRIREFLLFSSSPNPAFAECLCLVRLYHERMCAAWRGAEGDAAMQTGMQSRFDLLRWMIDQGGGERFDSRSGRPITQRRLSNV